MIISVCVPVIYFSALPVLSSLSLLLLSSKKEKKKISRHHVVFIYPGVPTTLRTRKVSCGNIVCAFHSINKKHWETFRPDSHNNLIGLVIRDRGNKDKGHTNQPSGDSPTETGCQLFHWVRAGLNHSTQWQRTACNRQLLNVPSKTAAASELHNQIQGSRNAVRFETLKWWKFLRTLASEYENPPAQSNDSSPVVFCCCFVVGLNKVYLHSWKYGQSKSLYEH